MEQLERLASSVLACLLGTPISPTEEFDPNLDLDSDGDVDENDRIFAREMSRLMAAAVACEEKMTTLLRKAAADFGGELSGLDYKFKGKESLQRKINSQINQLVMEALEKGDDGTNVDYVAAVWMTTDALRYTILLPTERYTAGVLEAMARMQAEGIKAVKLKNFWQPNSTYKGINDVFGVPCQDAPDAQLKVELQFHTPEGFANKMDSHKVYEAYRVEDDPEKKKLLWAKRVEWAAKVKDPEGVRDIPKAKIRTMPGEAKMYAELAVKRALALRDGTVAKVSDSVGSAAVSISPIVAGPSQLEHLIEKYVDPHDEVETVVELRAAVEQLYSSLTILVVLPEGGEGGYAAAAKGVIDALVASADCTVKGFANGWNQGGKLGFTLMCTAAGADDGVDFTKDDAVPFAVALHTAQSAKVQGELQAAIERLKAVSNETERKAAQASVKALCKSVALPPGASELCI